MKLIILISVFACSYAAKLDRTYLPPASASTAGGSPGSLIAPGTQSGLPSSGPSFGQPSGPSGFTQSFQSGPAINQAASGSPGFEQANGPASFAQAPKSGFEQTSQYTQPDASRSQFGRSGAPASVQNDGFGVESPRNGYEQPAGFAPQEFQPERARASIDRNAEILRYDNQNDGETYAYSFETSNGISAEESGVATNGVQAQGGYSYTGDDGQQYRVTYTADENGFQPQGDHLPTPHPIPEEILRSIEQNARAAADGTQEGAYNPEEDFDNSNAIAQPNGNTALFGDASRGYPGASPANQGSVPSYQNNQPSGKVLGSGDQSGRVSSPQYGAPNAPGYAKSSGAQGPNQYQPETNQGTPFAPTNPNFSAQRQRVSDQRSFEPSNSGLVRSGLQGQQQDDSGYQYSRPQAQSFGKTNQADLRPQQPQYQQQTSGSQYNKPQAQGPAGKSDLTNLTPGSSSLGNKGFGSALISAPTGSSGPANQGYGSAQKNIPSGQGYAPAGTPQGPSFPKSTENKGIAAQSGIPESFNPVQGSPSSRPNGASRSYTPSSSSISMPSSGSRSSNSNAPSSFAPNSRNTATSQGPQFGSNNDQGYEYGPGINPDGVPAKGPSGRGFQSTPSGYPSQSASQPGIQTPGSQGLVNIGSSGSSPNNQGSYTRPTGSTTNQAPQGSFSSPNAPSSGPSQTYQGSYFSGSNAPSGSASPQPFGSTPNFQSSQPSIPKSSTSDSAPYQYNRPGTQGAPTGSSGQSGSLPGFRSESQPAQSSATKSSSSDSSPYQFNRPGSQGASTGPSGSQLGFGAKSQPGQSSAPKDSTGDSAPYQYNRPRQGTQRQPGSRPTETFSGPRQPASFSSEEGYKY